MLMISHSLKRDLRCVNTFKVVNCQSATLPGHEKLALDVKHGNLIRFPGADDPSFRKIADLVKKMAGQASEVLCRKKNDV
jgi:hypothetical protein